MIQGIDRAEIEELEGPVKRSSIAFYLRVCEYNADRSMLLESNHRGVAQSGSAPHWGCGGRRFKSCRPDQFFCLKVYSGRSRFSAS